MMYVTINQLLDARACPSGINDFLIAAGYRAHFECYSMHKELPVLPLDKKVFMTKKLLAKVDINFPIWYLLKVKNKYELVSEYIEWLHSADKHSWRVQDHYTECKSYLLWRHVNSAALEVSILAKYVPKKLAINKLVEMCNADSPKQ
jgi:hypothetical protein